MNITFYKNYSDKNHLDKGSFTDRYNVEKLVYFEITSDVNSAISREKQIKGWNRNRKNRSNINGKRNNF